MSDCSSMKLYFNFTQFSLKLYTRRDIFKAWTLLNNFKHNYAMYIPILVSLKMSMKIARLRYNVNDAFLNVRREALESARADLCIS